jgi:2-isopropylmalate synthase
MSKTPKIKTSHIGMPPANKYCAYLKSFPMNLSPQQRELREWPNREITKAPIWCSVDLRDGNQALINPMSLEQKLEMFKLLVGIGFKEIEIGFPSAAAVEFNFTRKLIEEKLIPDDVFPQVLVQARTHLIEKTFESLVGTKQAVFHLYNPVSELQRRVVFKKDKNEIIKIAVEATAYIRELTAKTNTDIILEYSPESFTGAELDFSIEIGNEVMSVWEPTPQKKMIINLPSTVEMSTPNIYADMIEHFAKNAKDRDSYILSIHPHNDRGTAVAAAELALMAGADRIEGTLFGNGERTGNVDIITLALNLYSQGVDPLLDFSEINTIKDLAERCTNIPVGPRHPYAGELVFTAFSGSHQDAIRKGTIALQESNSDLWEVPYLPIDPADVGRKYEPLIRINSQSGKGGAAYRIETDYGYYLPKAMHPEFGAEVQKISDATGQEVTSTQIWEAFQSNFLNINSPYKFVKFQIIPINTFNEDESEKVKALLRIEHEGKELELLGEGNGPIDACKHALIQSGCIEFKLTDYMEHALSSGSDAEAASYIQIETKDGRKLYGVGKDANTTKASIKALLSAVNRYY